jgi:hypothetical protein
MTPAPVTTEVREVNPPRVGEMVRIMRARGDAAFLLAMHSEALKEHAAAAQREDTRMVCEILATMTPGQLTLLRFKVRPR